MATLVDVRGMPETLAQCTVDRLEQREVDLDEIGDGRVDPVEHPEVIEAVAACAALDAAQDEPDAD